MTMIYLPIAGLAVDVWVLLGIGAGVGLLSGIFGVGGGFLLTPALIFLGVPPAVAVASGANQVVGSSVSGMMAHWRRGNVDVKMGVLLLSGGFVGSGIGVWLFALLKALGQIDLVIALSYVGMLGTIGGLMLVESVKSLLGRRVGALRRRRHLFWHRLPFKLRFRRSKLYVSALLPLAVGALGGVLSAIMGVGGGFVLVPLMIYVIGMPTSVVVGTSLFQMLFVAGNVTFLQAVTTQTVDVVLMLILLLGGAVGAQAGSRIGSRLDPVQLRLFLALIVLGVGVRMALELLRAPDDLYMLVQTAG